MLVIETCFEPYVPQPYKKKKGDEEKDSDNEGKEKSIFNREDLLKDPFA